MTILSKTSFLTLYPPSLSENLAKVTGFFSAP